MDLPADNLDLHQQVWQALQADGMTRRPKGLESFIGQLDRSIRVRADAQKLLARFSKKTDDIIHHIFNARDAGDNDEAVWRVFIAAHFGRMSVDKGNENQRTSPARFLCDCGAVPVWTWARANGSQKTFHVWLTSNRDDLKTLAFGNHRKYESKEPEHIWKVMSSFLEVVDNRPASLLAIGGASPAERFDRLDEHLHRHRLYRFGRTGRFDFITLLADLKLVDAVPASCHLRGATGPLYGAQQLWCGVKSLAELDRLANSLAARLHVSAAVVEDALCNWQKEKPETGCG